MKKEIAQIVKIINTNDPKQMSHCEKPIPLENRDYYVGWDSAQLPVIKCNEKSLLSSWDDVVASHLILASLMQKKSKHF